MTLRKLLSYLEKHLRTLSPLRYIIKGQNIWRMMKNQKLFAKQSENSIPKIPQCFQVLTNWVRIGGKRDVSFKETKLNDIRKLMDFIVVCSISRSRIQTARWINIEMQYLLWQVTKSKKNTKSVKCYIAFLFYTFMNHHCLVLRSVNLLMDTNYLCIVEYIYKHTF